MMLAKQVLKRAAAGVRFVSIEVNGARYSKNGHFTKVLKLENFTIDTAPIEAATSSKVVVKMIAAPVTHNDLNTVAGLNGPLLSKTTVGGSEGCGVVTHAGGNSNLKVGDIVVFTGPNSGTWATHAVAESADLAIVGCTEEALRLPEFAVSVANSAHAFISASAILDNFSTDETQSVFVNGATFPLGQALTHLSAERKLNVVASVPEVSIPHFNNAVLEKLGAKIVLDEFALNTYSVRDVLKSVKNINLGVNISGGKAATTMFDFLANGAEVVTVGGAPFKVSSSTLAKKDITIRGFTYDSLITPDNKTNINSIASKGATKCAKGEVFLYTELYPFERFEHLKANDVPGTIYTLVFDKLRVPEDYEEKRAKRKASKKASRAHLSP